VKFPAKRAIRAARRLAEGGERMRRSAPPTTFLVASWSHPHASRGLRQRALLVPNALDLASLGRRDLALTDGSRRDARDASGGLVAGV
jgi:hypothetical protein